MVGISEKWLIIELNELLEDVGYREIESAILTTFGDCIEYFIPIHHEKMGSYTSTSTLMEGYIFVRDCDTARTNVANIKENKIFSKVLVQRGQYQTIDSLEIRKLKLKLKASLKKQFEEGSKVKITEGVLKNLTGEVVGIDDDGKKVIVKIKRLSREIIAPVPATALEKV